MRPEVQPFLPASKLMDELPLSLPVPAPAILLCAAIRFLSGLSEPPRCCNLSSMWDRPPSPCIFPMVVVVPPPFCRAGQSQIEAFGRLSGLRIFFITQV